MKLEKNYFKVELKIDYENHIHIEKDFFNEKPNACTCFSEKFKLAEYGYLQNRFNVYSVTLAEVFTDEHRTVIHKIRKAPL